MFGPHPLMPYISTDIIQPSANFLGILNDDMLATNSRSAHFFLHLDTSESCPQFMCVFHVKFLCTIMPNILALSTDFIFLPYLSIVCR